MIDGSINTYYYDVIIGSEMTINFNLVLDYIREQLLAKGETNITLFDISNYFEDNIEEIISNTTDNRDFIGDDNEYTLECISDDFENYLEKRYGNEYERL